MSKLKLIKKIFMEAFQWSAFATPIFVTGQRMAMKECDLEMGCDSSANTEYWLLISGIIAYVAGITLVVWLPIKIFVVWKKVLRIYEGLWFPGNLLYVLFSAIPCTVFVLIAHENCDVYYRDDVDCFYYFRGAPIETLIIMLVVTDWSEKIRYIRLRSADDNMRTNKYTSAGWDRRRQTSVEESTIQRGESALGASRRSSISRHSLLYRNARKGPLRQRIAQSLKWTDARPENLLRDMMLAYDAYLLLSLSLVKFETNPSVFETGWIYPIYIIAIISFLPYSFSPNSDMRSSVTILLQDIPYFILRIALFGRFGSELVLNTSVLFLLKNFFVTFAFIYFNIILPKYNKGKKKNTYDLENIGAVISPATIDPPDNNTRIEASHYDLEHDDLHDQYLSEERGISNPGFTPREQINDEFRHRQSIRSQNQQSEYWPESSYQPRDVEDEVQYASHHTAAYQEPYVARIENVPPLTHEVAIENYQDFSESEEEQPEPQTSPPKPKRKIVNYESLNNPSSHLYSQDEQKKPAIYDVEFETQRTEPGPSSQTKANTPPEALSKRTENTGRSNIEAEATPTKVHPNDVTENPVSEPVYSKINRSATKSRRKAPPPPSKPTIQILRNSSKKKGASPVLPPPPPELLEQGVKIPNGHITDTMKEALNAMDEAADYGLKIGDDWSSSTTPRSTPSMKKVSSQHLSAQSQNEDTFDSRL